MHLLSQHKQIKTISCIKTVPQHCGISQASRIARFALGIIKKYTESGLFAFDPAVMTFLTALAREENSGQKDGASELIIKRESHSLETIINKTSFVYILRNGLLNSPSYNSAYADIFNIFSRQNGKVINPSYDSFDSFSFNGGQSFIEKSRRYFIAYGKNMRQTLNKMEQNRMALTTYDYLKIKSAILSMSEYSKNSGGNSPAQMVNSVGIENIHVENNVTQRVDFSESVVVRQGESPKSTIVRQGDFLGSVVARQSDFTENTIALRGDLPENAIAWRDNLPENTVAKETLFNVMQSVAMGNLLFVSEMFDGEKSFIFNNAALDLQETEAVYESAKMLFRQAIDGDGDLTDAEAFQKQAGFMETEFRRLYEKLETVISNKSVIKLETRKKADMRKKPEQTEKEIRLIYDSLTSTQRVIINKLLREKNNVISNEKQLKTAFHEILTNNSGGIYALETELKLLESKIKEAYETLLSFENITHNISGQSFEDIINDNGVPSTAIINQLNKTIEQIKAYRQINDNSKKHDGATAIYKYPQLSFIIRKTTGHYALEERRAEHNTEYNTEHRTEVFNRLDEFERSVTYSLEHLNTALERRDTAYKNYRDRIIEKKTQEAYKSLFAIPGAIPGLPKPDAAGKYFFKPTFKSYPRKYYPSLTGIYYESLANYVKSALISVSKPLQNSVSFVNGKIGNDLTYNALSSYKTAVNPPSRQYISLLNGGSITTVAGKMFHNVHAAFESLDNQQAPQNDYALYNDNILNTVNIANTPQSAGEAETADTEQAQINVTNLINDFKLNRQENGQDYESNRLIIARQNQDTKTDVFEQTREMTFAARQNVLNDERLKTQDRIIGDLSNKIDNYKNTIDGFRKEQENLNLFIEENSIGKITSVLLGKLSKDLRMERLRRGLE